ncbi:hypothetical protein EfmJHP38_34280 (plasmid) [Enterococcus faecium]|nr:hypothetical protein EfmJHP38_34280 [Enterococcus faecium]
MFRLLKQYRQYRTKGFAYFSKEDFLELLDIPKSYKQPDIDKRVIKPIRQELTAIFKGLTIKKKYGKGRVCKDYVSSVKAIQNQRFRIFLQRRLS